MNNMEQGHERSASHEKTCGGIKACKNMPCHRKNMRLVEGQEANDMPARLPLVA